MINGLSNCNYADHHHQLQLAGPRTRELKIIARGQFCSTIIWQPVNSLLLGCWVRGGGETLNGLWPAGRSGGGGGTQHNGGGRHNPRCLLMWPTFIIQEIKLSTGDNVDCDQCMNQLNIAAGCSGWSWSVSECHVSAVAAVGPAHEYSTVFISLAAARMHALLALGPFATVRSPSAGPC